MPKILVIDDDELFRHYLTTLLERAGYEVRALANGSTAEAAIEAEHFDAVITDLYMPHVDGIETVCNVKRTTPTIPVIGISGGPLGSRDPCTRAMSVLGAAAILTKPLDAAALFTILRSTIGSATSSSCAHSMPNRSSLNP